MSHDPQSRVGQATHQAIKVNDRVDVASHEARTNQGKGIQRGQAIHESRTTKQTTPPCRSQPQAGHHETYRRFTLYVERDSQPPIILGRGGERLRDIGTQAREELEALLGTRVYLDLRVKLAKEWQRDPRKLARFGF